MGTRAHELDAWIRGEDRHGADAWHEGRHEDVYGEEFHMHLVTDTLGLASSNTREGWQ